MEKLIKGEWYEFDECKDCLLQYNDGERTKGWLNGNYAEEYRFSSISHIAKPASEKMLKKYGVMKEKKKLNLHWNLIYLVASATQIIACVSSLLKGDIVLANTYLILSILFFNWYSESVDEKI